MKFYNATYIMIKVNSYLQFNDIFTLKFLKYLATGLINTFFGYTIYAFFIFLDFQYQIAMLLATILGILFNYYSYNKITFKKPASWRIFKRYIYIYLFIFIVNSIALNLIMNYFSLSPYLGQLLCLPLVVFASWIFLNNWVYNRS
jgi:putative flippase GtrA